MRSLSTYTDFTTQEFILRKKIEFYKNCESPLKYKCIVNLTVPVCRHEVRSLRQLFRRLNQLATLDHVRMRMVDGDVKAQGLQQDVLVADQLLGLLYIGVRSRIDGRLIAQTVVEAKMSDLYDVFEFPRLFFDFGCEKQRRRGQRIAVESGEGVEHVKTLHVDNRGVDT